VSHTLTLDLSEEDYASLLNKARAEGRTLEEVLHQVSMFVHA
jgi:hypothetical protein